MIARVNRFHGLGSLRFVYRNGNTVRNPLLALKFVLNDRRQQFRATVVVSKKVSKLAVVRNRIRRRLYSQLSEYQKGIVKPYDIVLTVFSEELANIPSDELARMLYVQLTRANILEKDSPAQTPDSKPMV